MNASCKFAVIGDGKLSLGVELLRSTSNSNDVTVNIEGNDGRAIVIEHSSNVGIRLLYVRHGTVNVSDVFITSDAVNNSGNANYAMFDSAASAISFTRRRAIGSRA